MFQKLAVARNSVVTLVLFAGMAQAQTQSLYRVDYFANANTAGAQDATLRLDNNGVAASNLCADIFIFDSNEEMSECCACLETPDGLRALSINADLTANPLTGVVLNTGVIKVVPAAPAAGTCPDPYYIDTVAGAQIQSWATHIQDTTFAVTETLSQVSALSSAEQTILARQCGARESRKRQRDLLLRNGFLS